MDSQLINIRTHLETTRMILLSIDGYNLNETIPN